MFHSESEGVIWDDNDNDNIYGNNSNQHFLYIYVLPPF